MIISAQIDLDNIGNPKEINNNKYMIKRKYISVNQGFNKVILLKEVITKYIILL